MDQESGKSQGLIYCGGEARRGGQCWRRKKADAIDPMIWKILGGFFANSFYFPNFLIFGEFGFLEASLQASGSARERCYARA